MYELRTYSLVPSKVKINTVFYQNAIDAFWTQVGAFMALSKEKFHLRTEHSKLLGYWTVELGGLNQVSECYLSHQLVSALNIELKRKGGGG